MYNVTRKRQFTLLRREAGSLNHFGSGVDPDQKVSQKPPLCMYLGEAHVRDISPDEQDTPLHQSQTLTLHGCLAHKEIRPP